MQEEIPKLREACHSATAHQTRCGALRCQARARGAANSVYLRFAVCKTT